MRYFITIVILIFSNLYGDILSDTLDKGKEIYVNIKSKGDLIYNRFLKDREENASIRFEKIWSSVRENLIEGVNLYNKREKAPDKRYIFGEDKEDITEDINRLLDETISILINKDLVSYQNKIEELNRKIENKRLQLAEYRERQIGADDKSSYNKKIETLKREIDNLDNDISALKSDLKQKFQDIGIELSNEPDRMYYWVEADGLILFHYINFIETIKPIN